MNTQISNIILISDLIDSRKRKEHELAFYSTELEKLQKKMHYLKLEINLTNDILHMIEQKKIREIKP